MPLKLSPLAGVDSHGHLSVLRDPEGRLSADEAAADSAWKPLPGAVNAGYTSDILWLRLSVQRPVDAPAQWLAQFSNALLDDVRLYRQDASGQWQLAMQSGEDMGRSNWPVDARNVQLPLTLQSADPTPLLLRIRTRNAMSTTLGFATPEVYAGTARR